MKPQAPAEYRGEFRPIKTTAPDIQLCEHLPLTARQAHHLAVVRSVGQNDGGINDHHPGYYYMLTGRAPDSSFPRMGLSRGPRPDDWPFMGSVVASARSGEESPLPPVVSLPTQLGFPKYVRPGQFGARLGVQFDPLIVNGSHENPCEFSVPALSLHETLSHSRVGRRRGLLTQIDAAHRAFERSAASVEYSERQQQAFSLLLSSQTKDAFDLSHEPESIRNRYGDEVNAMSFLMARRLVEAGVPFVSIFWKGDPQLDSKFQCKSGNSWDTHGNNFVCLRDALLPRFDRAYSALLDDLSERGLLDQTLVMVTSEMGRKPKIGDPRSGGESGAGRDHWRQCMSVLFAGGGIRGGQVYGSSDEVAAYPAENPVGPEHIARTMYHALGVEEVEAFGTDGRPFQLLPDAFPMTRLF